MARVLVKHIYSWPNQSNHDVISLAGLLRAQLLLVKNYNSQTL